MSLLNLKIQREREYIVYRYKEIEEHKICMKTNFKKVTTIRERKKVAMGLELNL